MLERKERIVRMTPQCREFELNVQVEEINLTPSYPVSCHTEDYE